MTPLYCSQVTWSYAQQCFRISSYSYQGSFAPVGQYSMATWMLHGAVEIPGHLQSPLRRSPW